MPAKKYSHVKKKSASKKSGSTNNGHHTTHNDGRNHYHNSRSGSSDPNIDRSITQAMSAVSKLERAIARILLIRYEQDIARLFSTRLYSIALIHLPTLMMRCAMVAGPGWVANNADSNEVKDFFRAVISMDMRQAGERVATKSVLWSYTALRHFVCLSLTPSPFLFASVLTTNSGHVKQCLDMPPERSPLAPSFALLPRTQSSSRLSRINASSFILKTTSSRSSQRRPRGPRRCM